MRFRTTLDLHGKTATGFDVPPEVVDSFGRGRRPPVLVTIGRHTYRSTVAVYDDGYVIGVSADNRTAAGVSAGDVLDVDVTLDTAPREVVVPDDLAAALDAAPGSRAAFDRLSYSRRRQHVLAVEGAKTDQTRQRRVDAVVAALGG